MAVGLRFLGLSSNSLKFLLVFLLMVGKGYPDSEPIPVKIFDPSGRLVFILFLLTGI
ncbi:MAG: hypothetical protein ABIL27_05965 [candidate division WOR-3 bacterium]